MNLAKAVLMGQTTEEMVTEFQKGNMPELENIRTQMALVALSEKLGDGLQYQLATPVETEGQLGSLQAMGVQAFCHCLSQKSVSIKNVQQSINPNLFSAETTSQNLAKCEAVLVSAESQDQVCFKELTSVEAAVQCLGNIHSEQAMTEHKLENLRDWKSQHHELYCNVLLTLALRLCEPVAVSTVLAESQGLASEVQAEQALKVIMSCVEKHGLTYSLVRSILLNKDFTINPLTHATAKSVTEKGNFNHTSGTRQQTKEAKQNKDLAEKAMQTIHENLAKEDGVPVESVLELKELKNPEVQVALVQVAGNFLPLALIQEIVPIDSRDGQEFEETVGTQLIFRLLSSDHHEVEELTACLNTQDFSKEELNKVRGVLRNIHRQSFSFSPPMEVATVSQKALNKGVAVATNIVMNNEVEMKVIDVVKYFNTRQLEGFDTAEVQMAFLTIAKRISNPHQVEELVVQEILNNDPDQLTLLGFKVLVKIAQMNPYEIQCIDNFVLPSDLAPQTTQQAVAWVEDISQQVVRLQGEERVIHNASDAPLLSLVRSPSVLVEFLNSRQENIESAHQMVERLREVDNIPGQAALLNLACRLTSPTEVYKALSTEILTHEGILPVIGALALSKVAEELSLTKEVVNEITTSTSLDKPLAEMDRLVWQNVASFLQIPQQQFGSTASLCEKKNEFAEALKDTVQIINESYQEDECNPLVSGQKLPCIMENLSSQLALLSISERLVGAAVLEHHVVTELVRSQDSLCNLGVKALASAMELTGLQVASQVVAHLQPADLEEERARHRLATLLCLAHSQALQVSVICVCEDCVLYENCPC